MSNRPKEHGSHNTLSLEQLPGREHVEKGDQETGSNRQGIGSPSGTSENETSRIGETETLNRFFSNSYDKGPSQEKTEESKKEETNENRSFLDRARQVLDKKRTEIYQRIDEKKNGPQGEKRSEFSNQRLELVELSLIRDDPNFQNLRQITNDDDMLELTESMKFEGLKVPIKIIEGNRDREYFFVRAGFRRLKIARILKWSKIPAIILPYNTPEKEEYWTNIIENSARSRLSTYEIANAARAMRGRFHVTPQEFAQRAGYSESYIINLLRCIDRLPEEILDEWEKRAPIPTTLLMDWAKMEHSEAIKMMLVYKNRHERITKGWTPSPEAKARVSILRMASSTGIKRMQQARFAIEVARSLDPKTRDLALKIIDFCTGARNDIPGVHNPDEKKRMYKSRRREDREPQTALDTEMPSLPEVKDPS